MLHRWSIRRSGVVDVVGEGEILSRLGTSRESATRLAGKAAEAEETIGIHGVSVTASTPSAPASQAAREAVEASFPVHNTPTTSDPLHRTIESPKPITSAVAAAHSSVAKNVVSIVETIASATEPIVFGPAAIGLIDKPSRKAFVVIVPSANRKE